ncbi:MAG: Asp-tRNA(Asn)/Glu-tRNA(Gln) amidotransferase subunit GatA [Candidatus Rokubacteria bacterium]|nr:Asp-tRNA(Asn)/Glu-tRNA(Gln) amidotransferase subunit GatA [Candidatus Rokubacteria bacterium]
MTDTLAYLGIAELSARLARRELGPVELCRALLARCERLEPRLNAFITLAPERILAEARAAERELAAGRVRGPLHGVPIAVKDLCWTRGERTTGGSKVLAHFVPDEDASVVARLRAAGAIVFGKTNLPEFAYGPLDAYHYGPSRNPWDLDRFPGGSSMGAAAALAGRLVPGALGSDTGGSIRHPAHWSGITGLKPTYGRVPLRGVIPLATSLDHVGPMARSAEDCALLLGGIAGHDPADPTSADVPVPDYAAALDGSVRGLRAGVPRGYFWEELPADIARSVEGVLGELRRLGLILEDVEIPEWAAAAEASRVLIRCEAAAEHRTILRERAAELIPQVRERLEAGAATPAPDYVDALRAGARLRVALRRLFGRVDLLALPGRDQTAPRMDEGGKLLEPLSPRNFTAPFNLAGVPALTFPCGFSAEGLPIGLQLAGRAWEEGTLLRVAHAYQRATDWHARRPKLPV